MFFSLLAVTLITAVLVSVITARAFSQPIKRILHRLIADDIASAWVRYMTFAIYVVGISGGVRIHSLERYIIPQAMPRMPETEIHIPTKLELTSERWTLEIYRTIVESLQSIAWMLLIFFVVSLGMYVVARVFEMRKPPSENESPPQKGE